MDTLSEQTATAVVVWLTPEQGGRRTGPPTAPVYAANCAFPSYEADSAPGGSTALDLHSLLLEKLSANADGSWLCAVDFLARDLVMDRLKPGASILVMEGPKVVGRATIVSVSPGGGQASVPQDPGRSVAGGTRLVLPDDFADYAWEVEAKGVFGEASVIRGGRSVQITFYEPGRLAQDLDADVSADGFASLLRVVVIPRVTETQMIDAAARLPSSFWTEPFMG